MSGREVFADIAGRYDRINSLLSLGRDGAWRRAAIRRLPTGRILDLGAGTGAANEEFGDREVVALDPALSMLALNPVTMRVAGSGERLPFADRVFDAAFSAFVFRNLDSIPATLEQVHRVLRSGGALGVVDATRPAGRWQALLHRAGTAVVLPLVGTAAGARSEYTYLHRSMDKLPPPEVVFAAGPFELEETWRMGPLGFVYGAILRKA